MGRIFGFADNTNNPPPESSAEPSVQPSTEFDFAIVPEEVFINDAKCPHCGTYGHPELIEAIEARGYDILADLMICTDCAMLFAIVEQPVIPSLEPIMTRWTVPHKVYGNR